MKILEITSKWVFSTYNTILQWIMKKNWKKKILDFFSLTLYPIWLSRKMANFQHFPPATSSNCCKIGKNTRIRFKLGILVHWAIAFWNTLSKSNLTFVIQAEISCLWCLLRHTLASEREFNWWIFTGLALGWELGSGATFQPSRYKEKLKIKFLLAIVIAENKA